MNVRSFTAESGPEAVRMVKDALGPEAVIVSVRPVAPSGLARLWQPARVEVLAYAPEDSESSPSAPGASTPTVAASPSSAVASVPSQPVISVPLAATAVPVRPTPPPAPPPAFRAPTAPTSPPPAREKPRFPTPTWPSNPIEGRFPASGLSAITAPVSGAKLEGFLLRSGLDPVWVERLLEMAQERMRSSSSLGLPRELDVVARLLRELWPVWVPPRKPVRTRILIGPTGVGKTTALCKWMARELILSGQPARVYRLDGVVANTAEVLSVYAEVFGARVERCRTEDSAVSGSSQLGADPEAGVDWVDLPGIDWTDRTQLEQLYELVMQQGEAELLLVLNAAYDPAILLAQARVFSVFPLSGILFTHMEEVQRVGGLWSVLLGTKLPVRFFSTGQNVPGGFDEAVSDALIRRQFVVNQ